MVEIAEDLFQCPECGAGPRLYWSLYGPSEENGCCDAMCVTYKPELSAYSVSHIYWEVDESGSRIVGSMSQELIGYVSTAKEMEDFPLPHIAELPRKLVLKPGMFPQAEGEKAYGRRAGPPGTSGGEPSPMGSGGRSPRRRRRSVS